MITGASTVPLPLSSLENFKKVQELLTKSTSDMSKSLAIISETLKKAAALMNRAYMESARAKKEASKKALELFRQYSPKAASYLSDHRTTNPTRKKKGKELSLLPALSLIAHENSSHGPPIALDSITETRSS